LRLRRAGRSQRGREDNAGDHPEYCDHNASRMLVFVAS
jgi:hypothetical protein